MMPGRGSYGPGGKWIHDRAHRIMEESPGTPKSVAYATATQQGHKVGKSPKGFRTPEGVAMAKAKFDRPKKEYQKTAMLAGLFDELDKIALATPPPGTLTKNIKPLPILQPERYSEKALVEQGRQAPAFKAKEPPKPPPPSIQSVVTKVNKA